MSHKQQTTPPTPPQPPCARSLSGHDLILLGGAVGISVARSPVDGHLRCLGAGALVIERLSKQQSKRGVKFVSLLRSAGIPIRHCKNVTCEWVHWLVRTIPPSPFSLSCGLHCCGCCRGRVVCFS